MPSLELIETALPHSKIERTMLDEISLEWFESDLEVRQRFLRYAANSGVDQRYFIMPHAKLLALGGMAERAQLFEEHGTALAGQALEKVLDVFSGNPADVSHLIFTSCSAPVIPSIDAAVILESRLPNSIGRIPIFQHGCAGGVAGLALGANIARLGAPVILASVELCSLVFHPRSREAEQLVGAAIFGDGAAAALISPQRGALNIVDSASMLLPGTRHLMGYNILDDGFYLRLDRELPARLAEYSPALIENFLKRHGLVPGAIDFWLTHPGGKKILEFFEARFALANSQCRWSREVLSEYGNLSSATILFVLKKFIDSKVMLPGCRALVVGIGPGLTVELILIES